MQKPHELTRAIQITVPRDVYILLSRLMAKRIEADRRPSDVTKSAIVSEALRALAVAEGLIPGAGPSVGIELPVPEPPAEQAEPLAVPIEGTEGEP